MSSEKGTRRMRSPIMDAAHIFHDHDCIPGVNFELTPHTCIRHEH